MRRARFGIRTMRRAAPFILVLCCIASRVLAQSHLYPDWIRLKDSVAMRCKIHSESDKEVVVEFSEAPDVKVTIERSHIEWLKRHVPRRAPRLGARLDEIKAAEETLP